MSEREQKIYLGLLLHNHQPVGNFPWVFDQVYREAYLPMLEALERHPSVRLSLHYTGSLLDWLSEERPDFLKRLRCLVERGQVEIVGGGYYEPILPSIPDHDKIGQIRALTARLEQDFASTPTGMWLAERVWEPGLPRFLREAGMQWTILDDVHFKSAGLTDSELYGYYATEDQSDVLKVFSTSKQLRYTIPWRPVAETISSLRQLATEQGDRLLAMGDDGEKFGSWPDTQLYCWGEDGRSGWVEEFFTALEQEQAWLVTIPLGEYAQTHSALGRIYLPTSSYIEMTEWALPPEKTTAFQEIWHRLEESGQEEVLQFLRGGFWRNFLVRYPEVNTQHKKMLRVHDLLREAKGNTDTAWHELWKGQANDTYWHGLFGGAYMVDVRAAIFHHLIVAERMVSEVGDWQRISKLDFDRDTHNEILLENSRQNLYFAPEQGGMLFEWDIKERHAHNLLSVMSRYHESYHTVLRKHEAERRRLEQEGGMIGKGEPGSPHTTVRTKEDNLDRLLVIDAYRRGSVLDHFLPAGLQWKRFAQGQYQELGDFHTGSYRAQYEESQEGLRLSLEREGRVQRAGAMGPVDVFVRKTIWLPVGQEEMKISYEIENRGEAPLYTRFGSEWNLNLLGGGKNPQAYCRVQGREYRETAFESEGEDLMLKSLYLGNSWLNQEIRFRCSEEPTLWRYSLDAITGSEAGFERTHQGTSFLFLWSLALAAGKSWRGEIEVKSQGIENKG